MVVNNVAKEVQPTIIEPWRMADEHRFLGRRSRAQAPMMLIHWMGATLPGRYRGDQP